MKKPTLEKAKNTEHVLQDVGTLYGAVTGAVVGVAAGPPGVIAGTAIGAAIGTVVGVVMDRNSHEGDVHDKELDEAIGVTSGSIGAPKSVRTSLIIEQKVARAAAEAHVREIEAELEGETKS